MKLRNPADENFFFKGHNKVGTLLELKYIVYFVAMIVYVFFVREVFSSVIIWERK